MHEMSIVTSILSIIQDEMAKHNVHKLLKVYVRYGALTNIVPDSLQFAFEVLTKDTEFDGAILETEEVPLTLRCSNCSAIYTPEDKKEVFFFQCPSCGKEVGYVVETGRELYIQHLEAE